LLQRLEILPAAVGADHELAVEDVAALREAQLGEVAPERLAIARLDEEVAPVDEHDRAEPVQLRLVEPAVAVGELAGGAPPRRPHGAVARPRPPGAQGPR